MALSIEDISEAVMTEANTLSAQGERGNPRQVRADRAQRQDHGGSRMSRARSMTRFTVQGRGNFPLDMLRYDSCWPADTASAMSIGRSDPADTITLLTWGVGITPDRWRSFGWTVTSQERV